MDVHAKEQNKSSLHGMCFDRRAISTQLGRMIKKGLQLAGLCVNDAAIPTVFLLCSDQPGQMRGSNLHLAPHPRSPGRDKSNIRLPQTGRDESRTSPKNRRVHRPKCSQQAASQLRHVYSLRQTRHPGDHSQSPPGILASMASATSLRSSSPGGYISSQKRTISRRLLWRLERTQMAITSRMSLFSVFLS